MRLGGESSAPGQAGADQASRWVARQPVMGYDRKADTSAISRRTVTPATAVAVTRRLVVITSWTCA